MRFSHTRPENQKVPQPALPVYFNCIDAVRLLAALTVVIFHYHHFYLADYLSRSEIPDQSSFPYAALLGPLFVFGHVAVELFWVISGFVFIHVYLCRATTLGRFALARFARLYPLHLATLLVVAALQWVSLTQVGHWQIYGNNTAYYFLFQLFMASDWTRLSQGLSFNGPIWSVSLEIGAYFIFFFALALLRRFRIWAALGLVLLCWGIPVWPGAALPVLRMGVFDCAGYFFTGVVLYFFFACFATRPGVLVGVALGCVLAGFISLMSGLTGWAQVSFSAALVLMAGLCDMHLREAGAPLRAMGNISYSLYLVHVPLQMIVLLAADLFLGGTRAFVAHPLTLPVYLLGAVLLAVLAFIYFERPAGRRCRAWLGT